MSKKSKSTTEPSKFAKPYIEQGANALGDAYSQNSGNIQGYTDSITGLIPGMIEKYNTGDSAVNSARAYNTDVTDGKYLDAGNPYLQDMITNSNNDIRNQLQASLGARGLTGGSDYAGLISKNVAQNTTGLRYNDYNAERGRMSTAAGQAPGLASADAIQIAPLLATLDASQTPVQAAAGYASGLGGLLGGYNTTTQKQGAGSMLGGILGAGLSGWASGGFKGV